MVKKISVSLPDDLFKLLTRLSIETGRARSSIITDALKAYIGEPGKPEEPRIYPTALWKLRSRSVIKLRSPKFARTRVRGEWIIESEV